ncbi:MAG: DUF11 domain-containing protein [Microcoleus sp. PH2017_01_SCD_O_A]|uniref:hypothetical protein n=1 Tax=Microcoleus sp. PH2017_01_SCD_O_A TaxID=2798812 RepID=UPI001E17BF0D|nr:hypothetical protein [Microcoleus sp. PH2017_01_SCD_O_A]MCC3424564.1 DUF11 domain-containing protein [Microcoleus sp. PH2017_01_SCD_O_A]TAG65219.1 MAG: DUF11 domain-containing protein [Oscillatoriales cyanobacterium]
MTNISLGQTIDGSLSSTDAKNPKRLGSFSDEYTLTGASNWQQVQVNLDSTDLDSYLQLVNASTGEVITYNDGLIKNGKNSQLKFTVIPGVNYAIRATSFFENEIGNYNFKTSSLGIASSLVVTRNGQEAGTVDPLGRFVQIGSFVDTGSGSIFADIAFSNDNKLLGIQIAPLPRQLYKINPETGSSSVIGDFPSGVEMAALEFSPSNILYGASRSNSSNSSKLYTINPQTGAASSIANFPFDSTSGGDIAFDPVNNRFLFAKGSGSSFSLFSVSLTGQSTKIGDIGFGSVFGLSFEGSTLVGFTGDNKRIIIDPATGKGTFDRNITGLTNGYTISGAGSIPIATLTPTPTPPTVVTPTPTPPTVVTPTPTPPTVVTPPPTPPTVVTPPPLTIPIPIQTSTVPPSQIPKPDSRGEVDLDPLKLKVINGQFTFKEKTNSYEASGTIQIGRKDGIFPLITVQQGTVEYDDKNLSVKDATVFSNIGKIAEPLFQGKFAIERGKATTSELTDLRGLPGEFKLAGIDIDFKGLSINSNSIGLRSEFTLPEGLGKARVVLDGNNSLLIDKDGARIAGDKVSIPSTPKFPLFGNLMNVNATDLDISIIPAEKAFKLQGKLVAEPITQQKKGLNVFKQNPELTVDFAGDNYIQIKDVGGKPQLGIKGVASLKNIDLPGGWGLNEASLAFDSDKKEAVVKGKVNFPFAPKLAFPPTLGGIGLVSAPAAGVEVGVKYSPFEFNSISLEGDNLNFAITPPLPPPIGPKIFLQRLKLGVNNLAKSATDPIEAVGGIGFSYGPKYVVPLKEPFKGVLENGFGLKDPIEGSLVDIQIDGKVSSERLAGTLKLNLINENFFNLQGNAEWNWKNKEIKQGGSFGALGNTLSGQASLTTNTETLDVDGAGSGKLKIPDADFFGFFRNRELASGNFQLQYRNNESKDDDFITTWGQINIPLINVGLINVGTRVYYGKGELQPLGPKELDGISKTAQQLDLSSSNTKIASSILDNSNSFGVAQGTEWILLGADWENPTSNSPIEVVSPNGTIFTEGNFPTDKIAIVNDLTGAKTKAVIVRNPEPGTWDLKLTNSSGLGNIQYKAFRDSKAPTVQVTAASRDVSGQNVTINYSAFDSDSTAKVSLFYDNDNQGFDGILIKDGLEEKDGAGNFVWNTQGIATGDYYVYAMAMDENNAPVFSYAPLPIKVTESADLSVTKTADRDTAIPGSNVTYTVAVTNNGTDNAKGAILTETLPEGAKFVSANIAPTKQSGNELTFDLGDVAKGQISTISITVTAPTTGNITGTSRITSKTYDPDISNDIDFASTTVTDDGTESTTNNVVATPTPTPPRPPLRQVLGTPENDNLVGIDAADSIAGFAGDDTLAGLGGDDIIYGNKGNDILTGNSGNDNIFGGRGNDLILGGADNDRLKGNEGDDTLSGDLGRDILIGGPGSDTFVLPKNAAVTGDILPDAILDFQLGADKIGLTEGLTQANLLLNFELGNTVIKIAGSNQTLGVVVGVTPTQLSGSFVSINLPLI